MNDTRVARLWSEPLNLLDNEIRPVDFVHLKAKYGLQTLCKASKGRYEGTIFRIIRYTTKRVDVRSVGTNYYYKPVANGASVLYHDGPIIRTLGFSSLVMEVVDMHFEQPRDMLFRLRASMQSKKGMLSSSSSSKRSDQSTELRPVDKTMRALQDDEEFMSSLEMVTSRLTTLNLDYDDPRIVAIGKAFQDSNK